VDPVARKIRIAAETGLRNASDKTPVNEVIWYMRSVLFWLQKAGNTAIRANFGLEIYHKWINTCRKNALPINYNPVKVQEFNLCLKQNGNMFYWQVSLCPIEHHMRERTYSSTHHNLGTTWKCDQLHHPAVLTGESIASWSPQQVWTLRKWEKSLTNFWESKPLFLGHPDRRKCTTVTKLFQLLEITAPRVFRNS
jgi:hypothetical protein